MHEELHETHHISRRRPIDGGGGVVASATPVGASGTSCIYQHPSGYWAITVVPDSDACIERYDPDGEEQTSGLPTVVSDIPNERPKPAVAPFTYTFFYDDGDDHPTYYKSEDGEILEYIGETPRFKGRAYPLSYLEDLPRYPDSCTYNDEDDLHPASCTINGKVYRPVHHPHPSDDVARTRTSLHPTPRAERTERLLNDGFTGSTAATRGGVGSATRTSIGDENVEVYYKMGPGITLQRDVDRTFSYATGEVKNGEQVVVGVPLVTADGIQVKVKEERHDLPPVVVRPSDGVTLTLQPYTGSRTIEVALVVR